MTSRYIPHQSHPPKMRAPKSHPPGLIGIPCVDWMYTAAAQSLILLCQQVPPGTRIDFTRNGSSSIAFNRNQLVRTLLRYPELEWLCMIDSDMVVPPDAITRLLNTGKDVVGALAFDRNPPHRVCAARFDTLPEGAPWVLHEVPAVGAGCLLIRRRVLERIADPWFEHPIPGRDEDYHFCAKAQQAGFEVWLDGTTEVGHIGTTTVTSEWIRAWVRTPSGAAENTAENAAMEARIAASRERQQQADGDAA